MLFLFAMIFLMSIVSAQPQTNINIDFDEGFVILQSPQEFIEQNELYTLNWFVYNQSSGIPMSNSTMNCTFYISDESGSVLYGNNATYNPNDLYWSINVSGGNFTETGSYAYGIRCDDGNVGGATVSHFQVTPTGESPTTAQSLMHGIVLFILVVLLFVTFFFAVHIDGENKFDMGKLVKINYGKYLKQGLFFLSYLLLTFVSGMTWVISENYLDFAIGTRIFELIFTILWIAIFPVLLMFVIFSLIKWTADLKLHKLKVRNLPQR